MRKFRDFTAYVSPYVVVNPRGSYTKHIYAGSQRIASKLANGKMSATTITKAGGSTVNYTTKRTRLQNALIAEYDSLGAIYTAPPVSFTGNGTNSGNLLYFYHPDHLGSSSLITNADGVVTQHVEYIPFGEVFIEERNKTWNTPYLFNGKERDEETGLYYYGARYYDSRTSVWLSVDPLAEKFVGVSSYVYCLNNPIKYIDPNGKDVWVKRQNNGNYEVVGGKLNDDKGIYIAIEGKKGNYIRTDKKIGESLTMYSFYSDNGKVVKGAIINPNDKSGENFLKEKIIDNTPQLSAYIPNARNTKDYDFKHKGAGDKNDEVLKHHHYRGMPLSGVSSVVSSTDGKTEIYGTGRDVGNIGAGYVAGRNGLTWQEARVGFDIYQSWKSKSFQVEGPTTQNAERIGWENGWAAYQMRRY